MRQLRLAPLCLGLLLIAGGAAAADFVAAPLSGDQEVPANASDARGNATFDVSEDGTQITYKLIAANLRNAFMAHIHRGAAGANGPVVAFLFGPVPPGGGRTDGILATGTITAANLIGPLLGQPLSALLTEIQAGNTYVNIHTNDGVDPTNTGPGDIASGEIRSQIRPGDSD